MCDELSANECVDFHAVRLNGFLSSISAVVQILGQSRPVKNKFSTF